MIGLQAVTTWNHRSRASDGHGYWLQPVKSSGVKTSEKTTLIMIPVGVLVLGSIPWRWSGLLLFAAGLLLGALVGAGFGLLLGTLVQPQRINLLFSLVFTPLLFTGCSQYPWPSLARLRWFQVVTAANPMTYVSEALRGALVPQVPHIEPWICLVVLVFAVAVLLEVGLRGFYRRAID